MKRLHVNLKIKSYSSPGSIIIFNKDFKSCELEDLNKGLDTIIQ